MMVEIFDQLKKLLKNTQLFEEAKGSELLRITTLSSLQVIVKIVSVAIIIAIYF